MLQAVEQGAGGVIVKGPKEQFVETSVMVIVKFPAEIRYPEKVVAEP